MNTIRISLLSNYTSLHNRHTIKTTNFPHSKSTFPKRTRPKPNKAHTIQQKLDLTLSLAFDNFGFHSIIIGQTSKRHCPRSDVDLERCRKANLRHVKRPVNKLCHPVVFIMRRPRV